MAIGVINQQTDQSYQQLFKNHLEFKIGDQVKAVIVDSESKEIIREIPSDRQRLKLQNRLYA